MWFPKGFAISKENRIKKFLEGADNYEIYSLVSNDRILITTKNYYERLCKDKFIPEGVFSLLENSESEHYYLLSKSSFIMTAVKNGYSLCNKMEAFSFVDAFLKMREITCEPLFDAIYIEEFSLLLPAYSQDKTDDKTALGTFLSGGVIISTDSFDRLAGLVAFISPQELAAIVQKAGFDVTKSGAYLTRQKLTEEAKTSENENRSHKAAPNRGRFELVGRPKLEEFINEHIVDILQNEEKYRKMGIEFPSAVVLHGPPGCGKTFAVDKLIEFLDLPYYEINSSTVASPFVHDTSKKVSEVFDKAIDNAPSVIVIDEMEAYLTDRGAGASSGMHHVEEVAEFLRRIPEAIKSRVLVIAMTNMIDLIDPAILRRGRFDHIIEVSMPSKEEVQSLLASLFEKLPTASDLDLSVVIDKLTGKPLSDSTFVAREAARIAVKSDADKITNECVNEALKRLPKSTDKRKIGF